MSFGGLANGLPTMHNRLNNDSDDRGRAPNLTPQFHATLKSVSSDAAAAYSLAEGGAPDYSYDVLQRPISVSSQVAKSEPPAWRGSIAPAQSYSKLDQVKPRRASTYSAANAHSFDLPQKVAASSEVDATSGLEAVALSEDERTQVITEAMSQPYHVSFAENTSVPKRQSGLRPIVLPDERAWDVPTSQAVAVPLCAARTGTIDDVLSALVAVPQTAIEAVVEKIPRAVDLVSKAASVAQNAATMAQGAATIVSASVSAKVATKVAARSAKKGTDCEFALEPAYLEQQVKAKSLGLGQGSHVIVDIDVAKSHKRRKGVGLWRGLVRHPRHALRAAWNAQALTDASVALSGMMALEPSPWLISSEQEEYAALATTSVLVNLQAKAKFMDDDLTYDQWLKQQGVPFAALSTSGLKDNPSSCVSEGEPVLQAVRWKQELNSKSLEPWGTVDKERLNQRLNSYFLHSEHFADSFKRADHQRQIAAVLGYGIFRQWLQRRRAAQHEFKGMIAQSPDSLFYYTALLLIETMIFAMRVDGRIEQDEHDSLMEFCAAIFDDKLHEIRGELDRMLTIELEPERLAERVQFPEESIDMYLLSAVILAGNCMLERNYLETLAACLGIDPTLRRRLDRRAHELITGQANALAHQAKAEAKTAAQVEA